MIQHVPQQTIVVVSMAIQVFYTNLTVTHRIATKQDEFPHFEIVRVSVSGSQAIAPSSVLPGLYSRCEFFSNLIQPFRSLS
jgi:hypothetical protein